MLVVGLGTEIQWYLNDFVIKVYSMFSGVS